MQPMKLHEFSKSNKQTPQPKEAFIHTNTMTSSSTDRPMAALQAYKERYLQLTPEDNYDRALWAELQIISAEVNNDTSKTTFFIRFPKTYSNHVSSIAANISA